MLDDSSIANDLESLKIAARKARENQNELYFSKQKANRTDIVHAGYRFFQSIAAGVIIIYYFVAVEKHGVLREKVFEVIYPICFITSLILAISRIINCIPNPTPIIPVVISMVGWSIMLTGAITIMRDAEVNLDAGVLSDDELAHDPTFVNDLAICAMSLVGSSLYLVHAWLCYDCWWWDKKQKKLFRDAEISQASSSSIRSDSDSGMSSDDETDPDGPGSALPSTSSGHRKLEGPRKSSSDETDPITTLNEVLHGSSVEPKKLEVEDEPVRLYCCCVEIGNTIKQNYGRSAPPVHEFQVIHVM